MTRRDMIEFLAAERDAERIKANNMLSANMRQWADQFELAAQKFHAIICYLENER